MKFTASVIPLVGGWAIGSAVASPMTEIFGRAPGDSCFSPKLGREGRCDTIPNCNGVSHSEPYCPNDGNDIQCCVEEPCIVGDLPKGVCRQVVPGDPRFHEGTGPDWPCPGPDDIQCFIDGPAPPPEGGPPNDGGSGPASTNSASFVSNNEEESVGMRILKAAMTQAGVPFAWDGGDCNGPTIAQPPWDDGEIGYDCSGLVTYAVCQATGLDLSGGTTRSLWCGDFPHAKIPWDDRQPGDAVFFTHGDQWCPCPNEGNFHMGLLMEDINMLWNAPSDPHVVKAQPISDFVTGGDIPCNHVVRFL